MSNPTPMHFIIVFTDQRRADVTIEAEALDLRELVSKALFNAAKRFDGMEGRQYVAFVVIEMDGRKYLKPISRCLGEADVRRMADAMGIALESVGDEQ